jgi:nucleoside-diphosphate-sugar epimerase
MPLSYNEVEVFDMKICIVGGTGTISTNLCKLLASKNDVELTIINRGSQRDKVPNNAELLIADAFDVEKMNSLLNGRFFDVVVHFVIFDPHQAEKSIKIFKNRVSQFVFISTVATYNREGRVVFDENTEKNNPFSLYGRNKQASEEIFMEAFSDHNFPVTIIRPSQTYDESRIPVSVKGKEIYPIIQRIKRGKKVLIHGDGTSVWASMHSIDFALGLIKIFRKDETLGEVYQLTSEESLSWNHIYQLIADYYHVRLRPVYIPSSVLALSQKYDFASSIVGDKQYSVIFDNSKIKSVIGDIPLTVPLAEGIRMYLDNVENDPSLQVYEPDFDVWCDNVIERLTQCSVSLAEVL